MTKSWILVVPVLIGLTSRADAQGECVPSCRDGYVCVEGQCVSACNPPCEPGQICTGSGQCVVDAPAETSGVPVAPSPAFTAAQDPVVQSLLSERLQLQRTTHRLGGSSFMMVLGGLMMAAGLGPGILLGVSLAIKEGRTELGPLIGGSGMMAVGATFFGLGLWKRKVKLRRREAQAERIREIDEELRRRSPGIEIALGVSSFSVRW